MRASDLGNAAFGKAFSLRCRHCCELVCRTAVISSKGRHDLRVPLPLPTLPYQGPVDLTEC